MTALSQELVVIDHATPLADSREIARQLGIDHESFFTMVKRYQQEIEEDFGLIRFEIGVKSGPQRGKLPQYTLLTEDQTYAYMSYSQNTERARACKRLLVKAFRAAREQLQQSPHRVAQINSLWQERLTLFHEHTCIPVGWWCIFHEIAATCWSLEFQGAHLREDAVPDISVGLMWCKYARSIGLDMSQVRRYPHHYPDQRRVQQANIYPNAWLGTFRDWFHGHYLEREFPTYLKTHALTLLDVPGALQRRPLFIEKGGPQ